MTTAYSRIPGGILFLYVLEYHEKFGVYTLKEVFLHPGNFI
jgi:hypothetical protein